MPRLRASTAAILAAVLLAACSSKSSPSPARCEGPAPVAVAGPDRTVARGTVVQLDAGSGATEGDVSYAWRLEAIPAGSGASLSAATEARPVFTADAPGVYVASLSVTDACATSAPDVAVIVVPNGAPVAVAGPGQDVQPGAEVRIDGGGSVDPDGDPLAFSWALVARPAGSAAVLSGSVDRAESFVADVPGTYVAVLVVSDGLQQSAPSAVAIRALEPASDPTCPAPRPVANAGADQTYGSYGYYSKSVTLNGGASTGSGTPLTYRWTLVEVPAGSSAASIGSSSSVAPTLNMDRTGSYVVALIVNDGCQDSDADTVTVTVPNHAPSATIGYVWPSVATGVSLGLSASGYDPDGDPVTFEWTLVSAPATSTARLSSTVAQYPTLVPDVDGDYVVSLVVRDGALASTDTATIRASNVKPVASAGADRSARVLQPVSLDASQSTDANGTPLRYAWSLAKTPAGSAATLAGADAAVATFAPDVAGVYVARVVVSDGVESAFDDVVVAVWPDVHRLAYRVVDAEYSRTLDRIVAVSADPSALHLLDARTRGETVIALPLPPSCVSVSPSGLLAAVGHAKAISIVDLDTGAVEEVAVSVDVADVVIADDRRAFAIPRSTGTEKARIVSVAAGSAETYGSSAQSGTVRAQLRPGLAALYVAGSGYPTSVEHFDVASGTPVLAGSAADNYGYGACGNLWFSQAGGRIFTRCGSVYRASSASSEDLMPAGALSNGSGPTARVTSRHVDDSTAAGEVSAITSALDSYYSSDDDLVLRRYEAASLGLVETARLPLETLNDRAVPWRGRYVFYRSDGAERYVVMQLDPTSGALQDFGLVTF